MAQLPVKHRKGVIVVLYRKRDSSVEYVLFDRILNWTGVELCKGGIDAGESAKEAAMREVKEESGIAVETVIPTGKSVRYGFTSHDKKGRKVRVERDFTVFIADIKNSIPQTDGVEHSRIWFAPFKEAVEALTYSDMKTLLKELDPIVRG